MSHTFLKKKKELSVAYKISIYFISIHKDAESIGFIWITVFIYSVNLRSFMFSNSLKSYSLKCTDRILTKYESVESLVIGNRISNWEIISLPTDLKA